MLTDIILHMWKVIVFVIILALIAVGLTAFKSVSKSPLSSKTAHPIASSSPTSEPSKTEVSIPAVEVIAKNLIVPWAVAFLPDKSILVTERLGRVRLINNDGNILPNPLLTIKEVKQIGEGGLLGVAVHPEFNNNHYVYFYYTYGGNGDNTLNRVVRYKYEDQTLKDEKIIVEGIPGGIFHDGGRIKFGPDKYLYITTGDATKSSLSQDKSSLAGKILRVTDQGQATPGNPFGSLVYSYGHRNPQGITWDEKGRLWATEHGRSGVLSGLDELNLIEPGKNYGWPDIQGDEKREGMVTPIINSGPSTTWAPAGAAYFNGSIYFGGLRGQTLYQAVINGNSATLKEHFKGEFGRIREVVLGPDNLLYISTSNRDGRGKPSSDDDRIIRVDPSKL